MWNAIALANKLRHAVKASIIAENNTLKAINKEKVIFLSCKDGVILVGEEYKYTDVEDAASCTKYLLEQNL